MKSSFKSFGSLLAALYSSPATTVQLDCGTNCDQEVQVAYDRGARMLYILTSQRSHSGALEWVEIRAEGRRTVAEDHGGGWITFSGKQPLPLEATSW